MIVYSGTKEEFQRDVDNNVIAQKVKKALREKNINGGQDSEFLSWCNSLPQMANALRDKDIPNVDIAIEYQIPRTSKRVDFLIAGADEKGENTVIITELKQWTKAEKVDDIMQHSVRTHYGNGDRVVSHPSYQAYAYKTFIENGSEYVQDNKVKLYPCAYLHNYDRDYYDALNDSIYNIWTKEAPFFISDEQQLFVNFIKKYICKKSKDNELLYKIDNGRVRPSKALQDAITSVLNGNEEFVLLDDQIVARDICVKVMDLCKKDGKKRTIVIQGGPGTGKSVLAINLLKDFITKEYHAAYCTKNAAPRNAYLKLLSKADLKLEVKIEDLFKSPFKMCENPKNAFDCLIIDEAHRLVKNMYGDFHGKNQVKECMEAALLSIFLIDEDQRITTKDIGSIDEIKYWTKELNSQLIMSKELILNSQFRCNGSDMYIQLINNIMQIGESVDIDLDELSYDVKVYDDPCKMRDDLREKNKINNKARMIAGYCYDWDVKNNRAEYDIVLENKFFAKWNLENDKVFAINPKSFEQVGCIHTTQGLEFDYVGVIIGKDLRYNAKDDKIITDQSMISKDDKSSGIRTAPVDVAEKLIKNTYKTLLTRGQKGCYIYCEDKALAKRIKEMIKK